MVDGRRGRRRWSSPTLLPLHRTRQLSNTVSCWYCDFKFLAFTDPLFRFGLRHSRYIRVWFSMGIGFSLSALLGVAVFIVCDLVRAALVHVGNAKPVSSFTLASFSNSGINISLSSMGYLCLSSVISIIVHEFGHALAAASEGVKMEYLAIFLAGLFPGALVAFSHASLQALPRMASLRIYCAGIWHNAIFSAVCTLALFLLPFVLSPLYIHSETPMVLDVPSVSPLSGYLSPHDVIYSLDDFLIHTAEEWRQIINKLTEETHLRHSDQRSALAKLEKGYCIPHSLIEESTLVQFKGNKTYCSGELTSFIPATCLNAGKYNDGAEKSNQQLTEESIHCLDAKDVIKLRKCAYSSEETPQNQSGCICSHVESCMMPMQLPGQGWVEISYSSLECLNHKRSLFPDKRHSDGAGRSCLQTFVFIGDLFSLAHSVHLTSYQPRWSIPFATYIPNILEKLLTCSFHVSMLVALLNSLPVFFLDGESIMAVSLDYFGFLSSRMKQSMLRSCLLVGTFFSACYVLQTLYVTVHQLVPTR